jgi:hypothetical protein
MRVIRFLAIVFGPVAVLILANTAWRAVVATAAKAPKPAEALGQPRPGYAKLFTSAAPAASVDRLPVLATVLPAESVRLPLDLAVCGDSLVVVDPFADVRLQMISLTHPDQSRRDLTAVAEPSFIWKGVTTVDTLTDQPQSFSVYNAATGDLLEVGLTDAHGVSDPHMIRHLHLETTLMHALHAGHDRFVANGFFSKEMLRWYSIDDTGTHLVTGAGPTPFADLTPDIAMQLNRGAMAENTQTGDLVLGFYYASRLHVYSRDGRFLRSMAGPVVVRLAYDAINDSREGIRHVVPNGDTTLAYLDVAADRRLIYAVFAGRRNGLFKDRAAASNQLDVFAWDGRYVGTWTLGTDIFRIAVDTARRRLYGIRPISDRGVVSFDLADVDKRFNGMLSSAPRSRQTD